MKRAQKILQFTFGYDTFLVTRQASKQDEDKHEIKSLPLIICKE